MAKIVLSGKDTGSYQGYTYYKAYFSELISQNGDGYRPVTFKRRDDKGDYITLVGLSCSEGVYNVLNVGELYDSSKFLYDEKNRLAMVFSDPKDII